MTEPAPPTWPPDQVPVCPRHPDRESWVRCQRCARPVCPQCQRAAAVGVQCVDCVAGQARTARSVRTIFGGQPTDGRPLVTYAIIATCVAAYLAQVAMPAVTEDFSFAPVQGWHQPWRAITSAFLHSPSIVLHLALNMLFLWQIGPYLEGLLGRVRYAALYLLAALGGSTGVVVAASAPTHLLTRAELGDYSTWGTSVLGASGAVFGLFGALLVLNRHLGRSSAALYAVLAVNLAFGFLYPGIAWQAHLGGLVTGVSAATAVSRLSTPAGRRWHLPVFAVLLVILVAAAVVKYLGVPDVYR